MKDHVSRSPGETGPEPAIQRRAIDAVQAHPLYREAAAYAYCMPTVMCEPKSFIERKTFSDKDRRRIMDALADVDRVVIVVVLTATENPEPLSGTGQAFHFVLHPETMSIIDVGNCTWRS